MPLTTLQLEHIPASHAVHISVYNNVANARFLHDQLLANNADFEYAFIDACAIVSTTHVLAAVHQAVHKLLVTGKLRTRNVHSEIVFSLSPNNNITESFRRFGISPTTTSLVCVKISSEEKPISAEEVERHLSDVIEGAPVEFTDEVIARGTNWASIGKCYKVPMAEIKAVTEDLELQILGKLVMRAVG